MIFSIYVICSILSWFKAATLNAKYVSNDWETDHVYIWSEWICTRGPRPQFPSRNQKAQGIGKTMESSIKQNITRHLFY